MAKSIGRQFSVGFAKETTRGTVESAATFYPPFSEASVDEKVEHAEQDQAYGVIEDAIGAEIVKQYASVNVKMPIGDKSFPLILLAALGALSTGDNADSDPSVKDHTITVQQGVQHQALSLFLNDPVGGNDYKHALGMIESVGINVEMGKYIEASIAMRAQKGQTATLTPTTTAENRFLPQHATLKLATNLAGLGAASALVIKSLSMTIAKNLEDDDVVGDTDPADFNNKQLVIEGEFEANWESEATYKTVMQAGTYKALRFDMRNTDVTIGSAAKPQIQIDLARVLLKEVTRPIKINDVIRQTVSFKAYYSVSDTKMIQVVATNTTASY
jgi:hypothetical protein